MSRTRCRHHELYFVWRDMRARCNDPKRRNYNSYGGRGIRVCPAWDSFAQFLADVPPRPTPAHQIERIDNDRGYEPGNVRWATRLEQCRNKRNSRLVTWRGETRIVADWAEVLGVSRFVIYRRLDAGWSIERALTEPTAARRSLP